MRARIPNCGDRDMRTSACRVSEVRIKYHFVVLLCGEAQIFTVEYALIIFIHITIIFWVFVYNWTWWDRENEVVLYRGNLGMDRKMVFKKMLMKIDHRIKSSWYSKLKWKSEERGEEEVVFKTLCLPFIVLFSYTMRTSPRWQRQQKYQRYKCPSR